MTRVLFCGAWDEGEGYPRARALREGLRAAGVEVHECRAPAPGRDKQRLLRQPWRWPGWLCGELRRHLSFRRALAAALHRHRPDVAIVPHPGHLHVRTVARRARVPVVLDLFLMAYDTAVTDRALFLPGSLPARLLRALDRRACAAADLVLTDTPENALHAAALTGLPAHRFAWLPVGDPDAPPAPAPYAPPAGARLPVLFFGTGVPLHGLPVLIEAIATAPATGLVLVGGTAADRALARQRLGERLLLQPEFVDRARLQELLDRAPLVAGVFGTGDKARRVVPFKVVHALAAGRPVITADTPALRRVLGTDAAGACGRAGVFLVPPGDSAALAARLQELAAAPALLAAAASAARALHDDQFAVARTGARFAGLLARLVATPHAGGEPTAGAAATPARAARAATDPGGGP